MHPAIFENSIDYNKWLLNWLRRLRRQMQQQEYISKMVFTIILSIGILYFISFSFQILSLNIHCNQQLCHQNHHPLLLQLWMNVKGSHQWLNAIAVIMTFDNPPPPAAARTVHSRFRCDCVNGRRPTAPPARRWPARPWWPSGARGGRWWCGEPRPGGGSPRSTCTRCRPRWARSCGSATAPPSCATRCSTPPAFRAASAPSRISVLLPFAFPAALSRRSLYSKIVILNHQFALLTFSS